MSMNDCNCLAIGLFTITSQSTPVLLLC